MKTKVQKGKQNICRCRPDEHEYQDCMSGYWYLQHRKDCPLRRQYEEGKRTATAAEHHRPTGLSEEERDDLQTEKELLVDMVETIEVLLLHVKHAIQFHRKTGIFKPGLTDLEFAKKLGMVKAAPSAKRKVQSGHE